LKSARINQVGYKSNFIQNYRAFSKKIQKGADFSGIFF